MAWKNPTTWTTGFVPTATGTTGNLNTEIRDNLLAVGDHTGWTTHAVALTGSVTNPVPASRKAHYLRVGNLVVYAYQLTMGSTVGSGDYSVSLPVNGNMDNNLRAGAGYLYDASAYDAWTSVHYSSSTSAATVKLVWNAKTANGVVTHASPVAWAAGDLISGFLTYRAAT